MASVGAADVASVFVSRRRPLRADDLETATGVLVGGGPTPTYHDAILPTAATWLPRLRDRGLPYAGFSAGAMIAPERAIVGGWKLRRDAADLVVCAEEVGEDEEYLDVRPGLGLASLAVDVHASRWGTPTRLLHAVRTGMVPEGWAIAKETMVEVSAGTIAVHGLGGACRVRGAAAPLRVEIVLGGDRRDLDRRSFPQPATVGWTSGRVWGRPTIGGNGRAVPSGGDRFPAIVQPVRGV